MSCKSQEKVAVVFSREPHTMPQQLLAAFISTKPEDSEATGVPRCMQSLTQGLTHAASEPGYGGALISNWATYQPGQ